MQLSSIVIFLCCCVVTVIEQINQKSNSLSAPLKLVSSRMSPRASHRRHRYAILASSPGSFYRRLFSYTGPYKYKTSAKRQQNVSLRNRQMSLKGQKCRGELARMASRWRIDGVFWTWALKKWEQVFTRVGLLVNLYSVAQLTCMVVYLITYDLKLNILTKVTTFKQDNLFY